MDRHADTEERIGIFNDTIEWIGADPDLAASVEAAKKKTEVFFEEQYPPYNADRICDTTVNVSHDRSYQAAKRLAGEYPGKKIAVHNFANAFRPGGGVVWGAGAQEECLCRTSTLYPILYRRSLRDTFYKLHNDRGSSRATDSLIYTEGVIVCKTDDGCPERLPKEEWISVDVITMAAPDLRAKNNKKLPILANGTTMSDAELYGYHVRRAIHMLTAAAAKGVNILVLGAFGCGAFANDPSVVSKAYKTAVDIFPKVFEHIEFAVYTSDRDSRNYDEFKKVFGGAE